jgi:Fe-S-cluster-containing dehydrogenase component
MTVNRREFLGHIKKLLVASPAAAAFIEYVYADAPSPESKYKAAEHYWAMSIDIDKCIGCGNCVAACAKENGVPDGYFRTWVERYSVDAWPEEHPRVESPDGGKDGFDESPRPGVKNFFVPKLCNHCEKSPCVQVCPVGATFESPDGVVLVDKSYCLGCRYCVQACPYGCRYIDPQQHVVDKCSLCYHRITKGLTTACSETCPTGARTLADLKNPNDPIHEFIRSNSVQLLKPHMATRSKVYYRSLDQSVR